MGIVHIDGRAAGVLRHALDPAMHAGEIGNRGKGCFGILAMGDDQMDLGLFARAGVRDAPANARPEILARADFVTASAGGLGAVREMAEHMLRARGVWDAIVAGAGTL